VITLFTKLKTDITSSLESLKSGKGSFDASSNAKIETVSNINLALLITDSLERAALGEASDLLRNKLGEKGLSIVVGAQTDKGSPIIISKTKDLNLHVGKILKAISTELGGKGGGREDFAQGSLESQPSYETLSLCVKNHL